MARIRSSILVAAIARLASQENGAAYISRRGADEAGAIFITLYDRITKTVSLYEPAPQSLASDENIDRDTRAFTLLGEGLSEMELNERFASEARFDPDFWVIELEGVTIQSLNEVLTII
jgi:hypothetical protein